MIAVAATKLMRDDGAFQDEPGSWLEQIGTREHRHTALDRLSQPDIASRTHCNQSDSAIHSRFVPGRTLDHIPWSAYAEHPTMRKDVAMKSIRGLLLAVSAAVSLPAYSHEMIPGYWCTEVKATPKIIATFNFDGKGLNELAYRCGIVDRKDQWHTAVGAIQYYCDTQLPEDSREKRLVVPFVTAPKSFNDENHHSAYTIEQGLVGSCVVCVPMEK